MSTHHKELRHGMKSVKIREMSYRADELEQWGANVISGRDRSLLAFVMRRVLGAFSLLFRLVVRARLKYYHSGAHLDLATPVISVGNLTVGGTGKTPIVERLARELSTRGRKVTILSRGYKSKALSKPQRWEGVARDEAYDILPKIVSDHQSIYLKPPYSGDEPYMLAKNLPGVAVLVGKDRIRSARFALSYLQSDTLLLDDGMQYLPLRHKFEIVLLDQSTPFGTRALLPRGTLREPPSHLRRANLIVVTKCKKPTPPELLSEIRRHNGEAPIVECMHVAVELENLFTGEKRPVSHLADKYVAAISGIAVPESFESLLSEHGARVEFHRTFSDHHQFTQKEIDRFMERSFQRDVDLVITTEKDAVRFPRPSTLEVPVYFLRIEIQILSGQNAWDEALDLICGKTHQHPVEHGYKQLEKNLEIARRPKAFHQ